MKNPIISLILIVSLLTGCAANHVVSPEAATKSFDKLKALSGRWISEPDAEGNKNTVIYETTSANSAVKETLFPGTDHEMVSVYHLDNGTIGMTHYCALGNQPYLKANKITDSQIFFDLAGGTNFDPKKDMYMRQLVITFVNPDHVKHEWTNYTGEKMGGTTVFELHRKGMCSCKGKKKGK